MVSVLSSRELVCAGAFLVLLLSATPCLAAFRGSKGGISSHASLRTVAMNEVESTIQMSLEEAMGGGLGVAAHRLAAIEASIWQTSQSLPKNEHGRLGPKAVRYVVHSFFAKEHGWLIQGLEPHGMSTNVTDVHEVSILQDKAPAMVEALLETRQSNRGLALGDVVTMIAALERLIFDESMELLRSAYRLNGQSLDSGIDEAALHEVLRSYLLIFGAGGASDIEEMEQHLQLKSVLTTSSHNGYQELAEFEGDTVINYNFEHRDRTNPFAPQSYSLQTVAQMAEVMTHGYGKWQNRECRQMKAALMDLDPSGTGRIPLGKFYSQGDSSVYQFNEGVDYLRQTGALDETGRGGASVLIPNYLAGPTNCIASSSYYSVCCMNECEGLMNEIEHKIQAPMASPERLLGFVGNLSSSTVDAPRALPQSLKEKLYGIANHHEGEVPLHGRFFSQWLHFAFPNECPYPQITENAAVLTPSQWLEDTATASEEERQRHIDRSDNSVKEEAAFMSQWSDDEVLPVFESQKVRRGALAGLVRVAVQIAMAVVVLRTAVAAWAGGVRAYRGCNSADNKKAQLPW